MTLEARKCHFCGALENEATQLEDFETGAGTYLMCIRCEEEKLGADYHYLDKTDDTNDQLQHATAEQLFRVWQFGFTLKFN